MPSGPRIRANNSFGVTTDNPLTAGATSFNSAGLATLPVVSSAHAVIVLDPKRVNGAPEIVVVTAHSSLATVATITRGQYGTAARSHPAGTAWAHVPVDEDYIEVLTSGTRPSNPYEGQLIYETDTDVLRGYNGTAWGTTYLDPPCCRVTRSTSWTINDAGNNVVPYETERFDTDNMWSVAAPTRITFNTAGLYLITLGAEFTGANDYTFTQIGVRLNSTTYIVVQGGQTNAITAPPELQCATIYKAAAGEWVDSTVYADNTAGSNARQLLKSNAYSPEFSACWIGKG